MNKAKKQRIIISLISLFAICLCSFLVCNIEKDKTYADEPAYTVTNIEDLVTKQTDITIGVNGGKKTAWQTDSANVVEPETGKYFEVYTTQTSAARNSLDYSNNLCLTTNYKDAGLTFTSSSAYNVVKLRMKMYKNLTYSFFAMCKADYNYYASSVSATRYQIILNNLQQSISYKKDAGYNSGNKTSLSTWANNATLADAYTENVLDAFVTFGVYKNASNNNVLVFKVESTSDSTVLMNREFVDETTSSNTSLTGTSDSFKSLAIGFNGSGTTDVGICIAGVSNPLFSSTYDYAISENISANTLLKDITLNTGYAFKNVGENKVTSGVNAVDATFTYYNNAPVDCKIITKCITVSNVEELVISKDDVTPYVAGKITALQTENSYKDDNTEIYTTVTTDAKNGLQYDNNLSLYTKNSSNGGAIIFNNSSSNSIIQTRMKMYKNVNYNFNIMDNGSNNYYINTSTNGIVRYQINFNTSQQYLVHKYDTSKTILTSSGNWVACSALANAITNDGVDVIVTFGSYTNVANNNVLIMKIVKASDSTILLDKEFEDATTSSNTKLGTGNYTKLAIGYQIPSSSVNTVNSTLNISGVNKPLFNDGFNTTISDACDDGVALSTITLPSGYSWKTPTDVTSINTANYDANYTMATYYDKTNVVIPVSVALTVKAKAVTTLKFKIGSSEVDSTNVKLGESFVFTNVTYQTTKTALGWICDDKIYPLNYSFTANAEEDATIEYTLAEVDVSMYNGTWIRVNNNENGFGGLRFALVVDNALANTSYIDGLYGVVVPKDSATYYDNNTFTADTTSLYKVEKNNLKGKEAVPAVDLNISEQNGKSFYTIVLTNIQAHNLNREFIAGAFIEVKYFDDSTSTIYISDTHSASAFDIASKALVYADEFADYEKKILESYIANVVDVSIVENVVSKVNSNGHVAVTELFTFVSGAIDNNEITINLSNIDESSILISASKCAVYYSKDSETHRAIGTITYNSSDKTAVVKFNIGG